MLATLHSSLQKTPRTLCNTEQALLVVSAQMAWPPTAILKQASTISLIYYPSITSQSRPIMHATARIDCRSPWSHKPSRQQGAISQEVSVF